MAVGFTALANTLLLATLVYRDWMAANVQLTGYGLLVVIWLLAWWESRADRRQDLADSSSDGQSETPPVDKQEEKRDEWFREAQQCYLRGDWVAAEQKLLALLKQDTRDVESRLMLATLWRHQGRGEEALRQLDRLERLEAASEWQYEISAEREALTNQKQTKKNQDALPERVETIDSNDVDDHDKNTDEIFNENTPTDDTNRPMAA
ncbi:MAG: hypothetical protein GXP26_02075 [Planctomycetes bacterium]|nr:hypothetical protein [Planctomycetota bacterium]